MSENKKMDKLLQERNKQQQDLIKLKKMQQGSVEVETATAVKAEQTPESKWENFWYYNKVYVAIILVVVLLLSVGITQCSTRTKYDTTVVLFCDLAVQNDTVLLMGNNMKEFCSDLNENGQVDVNIADCSTSATDRMSEKGVSKSNRLMSMFTDADAILYIVDEYGFNELNKLNDGNFLDSSLGLPDKEGKALKISGTEFDMVFAPTIFTDYSEVKDFYIVRRIVGDTVISADKNAERNFEHAGEVILKMQKKYYGE